jgi:hypothetical protein
MGSNINFSDHSSQSSIKTDFQRTMNHIKEATASQAAGEVSSQGRRYLALYTQTPKSGTPTTVTALTTSKKNASTAKEINQFINQFIDENRKLLSKEDLEIIHRYLSNQIKELEPNLITKFASNYFNKAVPSDYEETQTLQRKVEEEFRRKERLRSVDFKKKAESKTFTRMSSPQQESKQEPVFVKSKSERPAKEYGKASPIMDEKIEQLTKEQISPQQMSALFYKMLLKQSKNVKESKKVQLMFENTFYYEADVLAKEVERGNLSSQKAVEILQDRINKKIGELKNEYQAEFEEYKKELIDADPQLSDYAATTRAKMKYPAIANLLDDLKSEIPGLFKTNSLFEKLLVHYFDQFVPEQNKR